MRHCPFPIGSILLFSVCALGFGALRSEAPPAPPSIAHPTGAAAQVDEGLDEATRERFREALCGAGFDIASLARIQCQFDSSGAYRPNYGAWSDAGNLQLDARRRAKLDELSDSFSSSILTQAEIAMSELLVSIEHAVDAGRVRYSRPGTRQTDEFLTQAPSTRSRELYSTTIALDGWQAVLDLRASDAPAFAETMRDLDHMRHERDAALRELVASFEHADGESPSAAFQPTIQSEIR